MISLSSRFVLCVSMHSTAVCRSCEVALQSVEANKNRSLEREVSPRVQCPCPCQSVSLSLCGAISITRADAQIDIGKCSTPLHPKVDGDSSRSAVRELHAINQIVCIKAGAYSLPES